MDLTAPNVLIAGRSRNVLAFTMQLSYCRGDVIVWSESAEQLAWLAVHNQAFRRLGGVPATVQVDIVKTAVSREAGAWGVINATYRHYAQTARFHVDACQPRSPEAKGNVERRILRSTPRLQTLRPALKQPRRTPGVN